MYKSWKLILVANQTKVLIGIINKITMNKMSFMFFLLVFIIINEDSYYINSTVKIGCYF